jgi:MerR family transcriptional regulator, light-induced transcriptional regulator
MDDDRSSVHPDMTREAATVTPDDGSGEEGIHTIGDVAAATGIATDTLRMWERRYGRPVPVRSAYGHRRFSERQMRWARRVAEGLALGLRPGTLVPASEAELTRLLEAARGSRRAPAVRHRLDSVARYDERELRQGLLDDWRDRGRFGFLEECAGPLADEIGFAWADGRLDVRHEHFASEVISDVLRELRSAQPRHEHRPPVLFATLRGERHGLGLHMAALVAASAGVPVRMLGVDIPADEIVWAAHDCNAVAVASSVSLHTKGSESERALVELRRALGTGISVVVGGRGAPPPKRVASSGVDVIHDFRAFERYVAHRSALAAEAGPLG